MQPSPYTPGEVAREVPGRGVQLAQIDERLSFMLDLQRLVGRIRIDIAARGIGKTSLLREAQRRAEALGALTIWVTAGEQGGLIAAIAGEIDRCTASWSNEPRRRLRDLLDRLTVSVGVPGIVRIEAAPANPASDQAEGGRGARELEAAIRQTVEAAAAENHRGLVIFIDEIQAADRDGLRTLAYAWQHLQSEGADVPAAVFAAGLPSSPEVIADVVTFSERFAYRPLQRLSPDTAAVALVRPAQTLGVTWDPAALAAAIQLTQGYPYSVQLIGDATWAAAGHPDPGRALTLAHQQQGAIDMQADLDALFRARWEKASPLEHELMRAMANLGDGPVRRADIAQALGATTRDLSVPRARLLDKGIIDVAGRGELEFTIPGFAGFVRGLARP